MFSSKKIKFLFSVEVIFVLSTSVNILSAQFIAKNQPAVLAKAAGVWENDSNNTTFTIQGSRAVFSENGRRKTMDILKPKGASDGINYSKNIHG